MTEPGTIRPWDAEDWRSGWRTLPRDQVDRILGAVRRGRALPDPWEAARAIGCAQGWRRRALWGLALLPGILLLGVAIALAEGAGVRNGFVVLALVPLPLATWFAGRRARAAEAANRVVLEQVAAGSVAPPPSPGDAREALQRWRRHPGLRRYGQRRRGPRVR